MSLLPLYAFAVVGLGVLPAVSHGLPVGAIGDGWGIAAVAGVVGLAAIAVWFAASVLSGRSWPARVALALVPGWAMAEIAATPFGGIDERSMSALPAVLPAAVAMVLLIKVHRSPDVDTLLRPVRTFGLLLGAVAVVVLALSLAVGVSLRAAHPVVISVGVLATALWFAAAEMCRRSTQLDRADRSHMMLALFAFGLAAGDRTAGRLHSGTVAASFSFTCARAVTLVGWCLLLVVALRVLGQARIAAASRQRTLRVARDSIARTLTEQSRTIEEHRHDLRSLIAGIQGATTTLTRYRSVLDVGEQRRLESALLLEITRLQHAINPVPLPERPFELRTVVEAVLTAEVASGALIRSHLDDVEVFGNPDATAAIVQNLVTNSRHHAPGATVTVRTESGGCDGVRLLVGDDGPGLPLAMRRRIDAVFKDAPTDAAIGAPLQAADGTRAAAQPRSGLGLAICARLAREHGARLRLIPTTVGTRIELLLPLVAGAAAKAAQ
jgi:signal transduction histidine kinase